MKRIKFITFSLLILSISSCSLGNISSTISQSISISNTDINSTSNFVEAIPYTCTMVETSYTGNYYNSLTDSMYGDELLEALRAINKAHRNSFNIGYKNLWNYFSKTDYDPNDSSKYIAFYNGSSATKDQMNREHVWPNSHGGSLIDGDIHMTRPTLTSDNSSRGNSFYVEGKNDSTYGWDPYTAGMNEIYRGISARIIFYCVIADDRFQLIDEDYHSTSKSNPDYMMGKLSDLLKWNLAYDIDETEINRNNGAEEIQGNRNPFIDDRNLATRIWGNYNENTRVVCNFKLI